MLFSAEKPERSCFLYAAVHDRQKTSRDEYVSILRSFSRSHRCYAVRFQYQGFAYLSAENHRLQGNSVGEDANCVVKLGSKPAIASFCKTRSPPFFAAGLAGTEQGVK